jgi:hypothetical protein
MKDHLFKSAITCSWVFFFMFFMGSSDWGSLGHVTIGTLLGCLAVYCTVQILKTPYPAQPASTRIIIWSWITAFLVGGVIWKSRTYLPSPFLELAPFLAIIAVFCISKMWPTTKIEEHSGDRLAPKDSDQEA